MTTQRHKKMFRAENRIDVKTIMIEREEPKEIFKDKPDEHYLCSKLIRFR